MKRVSCEVPRRTEKIKIDEKELQGKVLRVKTLYANLLLSSALHVLNGGYTSWQQSNRLTLP